MSCVLGGQLHVELQLFLQVRITAGPGAVCRVDDEAIRGGVGIRMLLLFAQRDERRQFGGSACRQIAGRQSGRHQQYTGKADDAWALRFEPKHERSHGAGCRQRHRRADRQADGQQRPASPSTMVKTSERRAPSAIRTPISFVRRSTRYDMTPYRPIVGDQGGEHAEQTPTGWPSGVRQQGVANRVVERASRCRATD